MAAQSSPFNIVLLGKTGSGKSASGNTILQQRTFPSAMRAKPTTLDIGKGNVTIKGTDFTVYDTPGLFNTERSNDEVLDQWRGVGLLQLEELAPTVYLLVMKLDRFTDEQIRTVKLVEEFLGERRIKNTWILFTGGDQLEHAEMTINELFEDTEDIKKVVDRFEGRHHVFNNRDLNPYQVEELIRKTTKAQKGLDTGPLPPLQTDKLPKRRLLLLGKTGGGKSATGNTILGKDVFLSKRSFNAVTTQLEVQQAVVAGRLVSVIDTPGLFDTDLTQEEIVVELARCIYECSPGPHAFLIVLPLTVRYIQQEKQVTDVIQAFYGEDALKYTIFLLTFGDQLEGKSVEHHIKRNKAFGDLVNGCGGRYHVFNNKDQTNRRQVTELLEKIDVMVDQNGGGYYSNEMLEDAERCRAGVWREQQLERERQEEQQRQVEIEQAKKEAEERIKQMMTLELETRRLESEVCKVEASTMPQRRLVLLGITGAGKSATGNTILGEDRFHSERSFNSVTTKSKVEQAVVAGRNVCLVDTPGLLDTNVPRQELFFELARSIYECSSPGPHALLIVLPLTVTFIQQDKQVKVIRSLYGESVLKYAVILFTYGDQLQGKTIKSCIEENTALSDLVRRCRGRYHVFNNKDPTNRHQVTELLDKIDEMVDQNGGGYYSNEMLGSQRSSVSDCRIL